jgi:hypothetical protein
MLRTEREQEKFSTASVNNKNENAYRRREMKKIYGMSIKDWKKLGEIMNPATTDYGIKFETVAEYIEKHPEAVTNRRVSKKGVELIEVTYPTGKVKEYPANHIDTATACEY